MNKLPLLLLAVNLLQGGGSPDFWSRAALDRTIFLRSSFIIFKTNFSAGGPLRIHVETTGKKAVPESDFSNSPLETEWPPES